MKTQPRMRACLDCLAILAELETHADAVAVIELLHHMIVGRSLAPMWRANEAPATTRRNITEDKT